MKNILSIVLLISIMIVLSSCAIKTNETEIAVKINKMTLFGAEGVSSEVFAPGRYHFYIPIITELRKFDTRLQTMTMTYDRNTGDSRFRDDLLFKTIDGNDISLDVVIQYRIDPKKAPYLLQFVAANDNELKNVIIRAVCRSFPRDIFGELKTEEFYNSKARDVKADRVKTELNLALNTMGVIIETVLTKDYRFNKAYQQAIEDKKIADQNAEKNKSATAAAVEDYKRKLEDAKGEVNKIIADVDGEFRKAKIEADAYYEKMKKIAQAIMAEGRADAKAITSMNLALAGSGGRTMVKLEIAKSLKDKKILLLPMSAGGMNLKTTNVNQLLEMYGTLSLSDQAKKESEAK